MLTEIALERLKKAKEIHKYGLLESWEELFDFQMTAASEQQYKEISDWAKRVKRGERVVLPLVSNGVQTKIDYEQIIE